MPIGRVLGGRWTIVREIGAGGTASVYEAVHRNGRHVAIKVLHRELVDNRLARRRFESEGHAANRVRHPDAVAILDDGLDADGTVFLVMELLDGYSMTTPLRDGRVLPMVVVSMIASSVLDVLAAAHEHGVVHRDVKPGNIFVTRDGRVKLLDFGAARLGEQLGVSVITQAGSAVGTPEFMAPEQAAGRLDEIDALTDIWAVGATMFQLLSRRFVHEGRMGHSPLIVAATRAAPPLRSVAPHVPVALAQVVDRALSFKRSARWPNARAMRKALLEACPELASSSTAESLGAATEPEDSRRLRAAAAARGPKRSKPPPEAVAALGAGAPSRVRVVSRKYWPLVLLVVTWGALIAAAFSAWRWLSAMHEARGVSRPPSARPDAR
ncbi:MAG TPA: serine/threonine-protein kinase [Polyangiaceae bacterium]|nr:serine/threonine-protein kinase [Polyangiaceae bacterium]